MKRNESRQFNISVEGVNCEKMYFKHLAKLINNSGRNKFNLKISPKAATPLQYAKRNGYKSSVPYIHIQDIEDYYDNCQKQKFFGVIDEMREAERIFGISYHLGYSNYTFELWMLLHVADMNFAVMNRRSYLKPVNQYFHRSYKSLDEFKDADEFQRILDDFITLDTVLAAVKRAKRIVAQNEQQNKTKETYHEFSFYRDNPDVTVHEVVQMMLDACVIK